MPKAAAKPAKAVKKAKKAAGAKKATVEALHVIKVGESLEENVEGHAARSDSPTFVKARATMHKILDTEEGEYNPYGSGSAQAHHGGSIWVWDEDSDPSQWRLVLNWAGIEWSAQFCCEPDKVDELRQNAKAITAAFPKTEDAFRELGFGDDDLAVLHKSIQTADDIAVYVDSIWNSCVPIPQPGHTGAVKTKQPEAAGVHNYPEPMCAIPRVCHNDFQPFHVDAETGAAAVVAPVAHRGSGDARVRVLYAEKGHPLAAAHDKAHRAGQALVLSEKHPVAKRAFRAQVKAK